MRRRVPTVFQPVLVMALLRHPELWWTALRQGLRLVPSRWWTRPPFVPVPDRDYMHFRLVTAYGGDGSGPIEPDDLITYLRWCRNW